MLNIAGLYNGLDHLVSGFSSRDKLYRNGLGDVEFLQSIPDRHPREVGPASLEWDSKIEGDSGGVTRQQGRFVSPAVDWLPEESKIAQIEMVRPREFRNGNAGLRKFRRDRRRDLFCRAVCCWPTPSRITASLRCS